jgi:prevent-host-death family protein
MKREVGAYEAKTRLAELLRDVARGEHVIITVRGKAVAELAPAPRVARHASEAVAAMQAFEPVKGVDQAAIEAWIAEGRR